MGKQWNENDVDGNYTTHNINYLLHLYSTSQGTQITFTDLGESAQPPAVRSILLDNVIAAILHTPAYW